MNLGRYLALILMMHFPFASFSQQQSGTPKNSGQEQVATSQIATVQLLDHARRLSDDARGLKPIDEIPLQARLADTVWNFDHAFAERLLSRSFELTIALLKDSPGEGSASRPVDPQMLFAHISSIAAKHNEKLEKKLKERWQEVTASVSEKELNNKAGADPLKLSHLLLTQSANYLKNDQQKARQLFRQSVSLRVSQDHCFVLLDHHKQAPDLTDILFSDTLDVLAQRPLSDANEVLIPSSYLFSPDGSVSYLAISGYNTANVATNMSAAPKNPALAKRYLRLLLGKVNGNEVVPAAAGYFMLKNLLPQYQVHAPELLDDVYANMATMLSSVSKDDSSTFNDAHKSSNAAETEKITDWEKRLENASKLDNEDRRDFEYFMILFSYLLPKEDFARAIVVAGRISNQELKERSTDIVALSALQARLERPDSASSVSDSDCNKIKTPLVRVVALSSLGQARLRQKATADALRLFEQAIGEASHIKDDQDRLQAKLTLTQLSFDVDSSLGFERAAGVFKEVNQFPEFNINRSALSLKVTTYGLKNELPITSSAPSSLLSAVATMCRVNCEETFQITRLLEKKEVRLWANFVAVRTGFRETQER